jgi:hypothetical protein
MLYVIAFLLLILILGIPDARQLLITVLILPFFGMAKLWHLIKAHPLDSIWVSLEFIFFAALLWGALSRI